MSWTAVILHTIGLMQLTLIIDVANSDASTATTARVRAY
jgi:hypothetical protein